MAAVASHVFAGCYERFLFGFETPADLSTGPSDTEKDPAELVRKFTFAAHKHAVKCVASAGPYLASGGADDTIHLYDVQHDKDLGFLMNPSEGAVPCLEFFTPKAGRPATHLFSGSADGAISIWRVGGGWEHLKTMRGHKDAVNGLSLHRTGRLALSVSRDRHIRMWNLLKGKCSYTAKLETEADDVLFAPSGDAYALLCGSMVTVHATMGEGSVLASFAHSRRATCLAAGNDDNVLLTGVEDGSVKVWDVRSGSCSHTMERLHTSRVRALTALARDTSPLPSSFATASSDGTVKVWDSRMLSSGSGVARSVATGSTNARLTCLCAVMPLTRGSAPPGGGSMKKRVAHQQEEATTKQQQKPQQPLLPKTQQKQQKQQKQQVVHQGKMSKGGNNQASVRPKSAEPSVGSALAGSAKVAVPGKHADGGVIRSSGKKLGKAKTDAGSKSNAGKIKPIARPMKQKAGVGKRKG